jgi:DMSO/TMAO reductase YedYZ molybdopterin-dependent catalytic subunit
LAGAVQADLDLLEVEQLDQLGHGLGHGSEPNQRPFPHPVAAWRGRLRPIGVVARSPHGQDEGRAGSPWRREDQGSPRRRRCAVALRGFVGKRRPARDDLPPGQYDVGDDWPVLTAEVTPRIDPEKWTMSVDGLVERPQTWSWADLHALPGSEYRGPIHCVTTWSKFDTRFAGVSVDLLLDAVEPSPAATHVLATSTTGYTTNLPLEHLRGGQAWLVWSFDGRPLARDHGGPVRLLVPHLYFWKSAKWVTRLTLLDRDQPGFWERNGYHDLGDPWREQRYTGD